MCRDFWMPNLAGMENRFSFLSKSISCNEYKISNPATQNKTPKAKNMLHKEIEELIAISPAIGAKPRAKPKNKWAK